MVQRGRVRVEEGQKWVRVYLEDQLVADTRHPKLVWERPQFPTYYFPPEDVAAGVLVETGETERFPSRGNASIATVKTSGCEAPGAARVWDDASIDSIVGHVSFDWAAMTRWLEEDEEVFVHARDPYTRIDILESSRRVEVVVDGLAIAESDRPLLLFETGLPVRYYLPRGGVRFDFLEPSSTRTGCPYKGEAEYWHARIGDALHEDIVWSYPDPLPESAKIAGSLSFYNERVDIVVDGRLEARPSTVFAKA
jgi:uncharacterized protein (DUF427 family)